MKKEFKDFEEFYPYYIGNIKINTTNCSILSEQPSFLFS